jgi:hypothetical protein
MAIKNVALINANDQVVNIVVVDVDDEVTIAGLHAHWGTVRWAEFDVDADDIVLDPSPEIWTIHTEANGFVVPVADTPATVNGAVVDIEEVTIGGKKYPIDSLLIVENAAARPAGWALPDGQVEVSLSDAE